MDTLVRSTIIDCISSLGGRPSDARLAFVGREPPFQFQQLLDCVRMWIHGMPCMALSLECV